MSSSRRNVLLLALASVVCAYLFYRADSFPGLVTSLLVCVWALIGALPIMDTTWRTKVGFTVAVFLGAQVILWPTVTSWSKGKIPCPTYIRDRVTSGIAAGLDLRGGMRLVYTVEVDEAIRDKRDHFADDMRQELATLFQLHSGDARITRDQLDKLKDKVHVGTPETAIIRLKFKDAADMKKLDERFYKRFTTELAETQNPAEAEVTFKMRAEVETSIRGRAVDQARDTVVRRVDELGLREATVTTRDEDIIVEVPGQDEKAFQEIKDIIRKTARLEFKLVDDAASKEVFGPQKLKEEDLPAGEGISLYQENAPDGLDKDGKKRGVGAHYARIIKRDNETLKECLGRFKAWVKKLDVPDDHQIGYSTITEPVENTEPIQFREIGYRTHYLYNRAELTGDYITDASIGQDQQQMGRYHVLLSFNPTGADRFEEITGSNVNRRFAIILDDTVNSTPVIRTKIGGGRATIDMGAGDPDRQLRDARELELVLRSGALPAPISPSNETLIGPSLGGDAIELGVRGMMVGISLVLVFMVMYYRTSGLVADVAVLFNLMLQMAVLAGFGATMTLPGIAGLALVVGMSVDANVLINERIREELRAGRSIRAAIEAGYDKAFSSIFDGHFTVFISGLILWNYGTGSVKGFAVTLVAGIICSLFTGVFCTRLVFEWWARGAKVKRLSVGAEF